MYFLTENQSYKLQKVSKGFVNFYLFLPRSFGFFFNPLSRRYKIELEKNTLCNAVETANFFRKPERSSSQERVEEAFPNFSGSSLSLIDVLLHPYLLNCCFYKL